MILIYPALPVMKIVKIPTQLLEKSLNHEKWKDVPKSPELIMESIMNKKYFY